MARTTATNFSGALQFPYATAGSDIFKKEDVQTLAQAVDQHNHTAGKGLVLSGASIPNGTITSAMIVDGTIATADIANGAITSALIADGTIQTADIAPGAVQPQLLLQTIAGTWSTTATSSWTGVTPSSVNVTTSGALLRVDILISLTHSVANATLYLGLGDGGTPVAYVRYTLPAAAGLAGGLSATFYLTPSAATHNYYVVVNQSTAGTLTLVDGLSSYIAFTEQRR
jgi:hypothetical protein